MKKWKCTVCGRIFEGNEPPVPCPVCKAGREAFVLLEQSAAAPYHSDTHERYVIIGTGLAGLEAAKAIRQRDTTGEITLVGQEVHRPYNRPALPSVVARGRFIDEILLEKPDYYDARHIRLLTGTEATAVDTDARLVTLASGESLPYTKLLLATGSNPFNPIQRADGGVPVYVLRSFADADELAHIVSGKRVVLVGGGILGIEAAMALLQRNCSVTVVEFAPRILSLQADETASEKLRQVLAGLGVEIHTGVSVQAADATGALLSDGRHLNADLVLASMGVRSEVTLAKALGLAVGRGIMVDDHMHTSVPGIWAAGDCAEYNSRVQAVAGAAAAMGRVAGASMAGDEAEPYSAITPATYFSCPGFTLLSAGDVAGGADEDATYTHAETGAYRRLLFRNGKLTGALFVGTNPGAKAVQAVEAALPLAQALPLLLDR